MGHNRCDFPFLSTVASCLKSRLENLYAYACQLIDHVQHGDYLKLSLYVLLPVKLTRCSILFLFKGVAPTSFTGQRRHHQDIETYLQETASLPTVPYHPQRRGNQAATQRNPERRGNQAATQQNPALHEETETLAMSE